MSGVSKQPLDGTRRAPLIAHFNSRCQAIKIIPRETVLANIAQAAIQIGKKQYHAIFDLVCYVQAYDFDPEILAACTDAASTVKAEEIEQTNWGYNIRTFDLRGSCSAFYLGPLLEILPKKVAVNFFAQNYFVKPFQYEIGKAQKVLFSFSTAQAAARFALEIWELNPKAIIDILTRESLTANAYEFRRYNKAELLNTFFSLLRSKTGEPAAPPAEIGFNVPYNYVKTIKNIRLIPLTDQLRLIDLIAEEVRNGKYRGVEDIVDTVIAADFAPAVLAAAKAALAAITPEFISSPNFRHTDFGHVFGRSASPFHVGPFLEMLPRPVAVKLYKDNYFDEVQRHPAQQALLTFSDLRAAVEFLSDVYRSDPLRTAIFFKEMKNLAIVYKFRRYELAELHKSFFALIKNDRPLFSPGNAHG